MTDPKPEQMPTRFRLGDVLDMSMRRDPITLRGAVIFLLGLVGAMVVSTHFDSKIAGILIFVAATYYSMWVSQREIAKRKTKSADQENPQP
jgi:hypothetical protein